MDFQNQDGPWSAYQTSPAPAPTRMPAPGSLIPITPARTPSPQTPAQARKDEIDAQRAQLALEKDQRESIVNAAPPGDTKLTGEEYLATLPGPLATQVKALSDGRLPIPTGAALRSPEVMQLWAAAAQYDPTLDYANAKTRASTRKEFTTGQAARNITSFNTAIGHLETLAAAAKGLNNWDTQIGNTIGNFINEQRGDPRITRFNLAKKAVVDELERAFRGTSGTLAGIQGWEAAINSSESPAQLQAAIKQGAELLRSRISALGEQYDAGMGRSSDPINLLDTHAQDVMQRIDDDSLWGTIGNPKSRVPEDTGTALSAGNHRIAKPDEEVVFGDDPEASRARRFTPEQNNAVIQAIRNGDQGEAEALMEKFSGYPVDDTTRTAITNAIGAVRRDPKTQINIVPPDAAVQDIHDEKKYGGHLKEEVERFKQNPVLGGAGTFIAKAGDIPTFGQSEELAAGVQTGFGLWGDYEDTHKQMEARTEAMNRVNPGISFAGEMTGAALTGKFAPNIGGALGSRMAPGIARSVVESPITADVAQGAGYGAGTNPDDPVGGAISGGAQFALGGAAARGIAPGAGKSAPLYEAGVRPTPGQRIGGLANTVEEGLGGVPFVGAFVRGARQQARDEFQLGAFNQALKEIDGIGGASGALPKSMKPGTDPHAFAQTQFRRAYDEARSGMRFVKDSDFDKEGRQLVDEIEAGALGSESEDRFKKIVENVFSRRLNNGQMNGTDYKAAMSSLGKRINALRNSPAADQELATALEDFSAIADRTARRSSPRQSVEQLDAVDRGYAKLVRIEAAAKASDDATFTPKAYASSVKREAGGRATRSKGYLRGEALGQEYATAGLRLGEPRGTVVDRLTEGGVGAGMGATAAYASPTLAGLPAALTLAYAPGIRNLTNKLVAPRTGPLAKLLEKTGRSATQAAIAAYGQRERNRP